MVRVVKIAPMRDAIRRRMWKMLLACGHIQYELFSDHPRVLREVPVCRCCDATAKIKRVRETGITTYLKKEKQVQQTLF